MVFQSLTLFARCRGPDEYWRKKRIFKLAAHFIGRRRNCYSIAVRNVHRALQYATKGRKLKREDYKELWLTRLTAACDQWELPVRSLKESMMRSNIHLNNKCLVDLAIWEPRSFKTLAQFAITRAKEEGLNDVAKLETPPGVITRGMIK